MYQNREQNPQGGGRLNSPKNAVFNSNFNLQLFAEKEENKTAKSKRLHLVISLILIFILALSMLPVMLINKNTSAYNSDTTTYVTVGELWDSDSQTINTTNFIQMLKYLSSNGTLGEVANSTANAGTIRGYAYNGKTSSQSVVVTLGGMKWQVVYLTKDSRGKKIATLLLNDTTETSTWSSGWYSESAGTYPSNMYGTSYIRAVTLNNGGQYATSNSELADNYSPVENNKYATFTMDKFGLTKYLVQPKYVPYQTTSQGTNYTGLSDRPNNEAIGVGGSYSGCDYSSKTNYNKWGDDYVWLPSLSELGYEDAHPGIWNLSVNERAISSSSLSWSRSSYSYNSYGAYFVNPSGSSSFNSIVKYSYAVRPALHLNLESAASCAAPQVSVSTSNSSQGTVTNSGGYYGQYYKAGALATITATPKSGYIFDYWIVGGTRVNNNPHSFTVTQNTTCVAYFKTGCTVTLNTNNSNYGTVLGAGTYEKGTSVTISAIPNESCEFAYWDTGSEQITSPTLTITVNGNITYTAVFTKNYKANITSSNTTLNITSFRDVNNFTNYFVTPVTANLYIYSVQVGTTDVQILKSRSGNLNYSGASSFIRYTVNEDNKEISFEIMNLKGDIDIKLTYVSENQNLPNTSGGASINGVVVNASDGGQALLNGYDSEDENAVIHVSAISYTGYSFAGWYVDDEILTFINSSGQTMTADSSKLSIDIPLSAVKGKIITAKFTKNTNSNINSETNNSHDFL